MLSKFSTYVLIGGAMAALTAPAGAAAIGAGTVSVASLYNPTVNLTSSPATYTAVAGQTFETAGTGSFFAVTGLTGTMNGTLSFSSTVGVTINQTISNFFTFADGFGGNYSFTPTSVTTQSFTAAPGSTSINLYLLGTTSNAGLGFDPTATSLTLGFNSTGGSPYSASASLSVPPAGAVPEPASWAMLIVGFGVVGGVARRQRKAGVTTRVTFA